jgi:hypothetical protein
MVGVDQHDKSAASYRPAICGKKWWYYLFSHILNVTVTNARLPPRLVEHKPLTHLAFCREIVTELMSFTSKNLSESFHSPTVSSVRRLKGWGHWPESLSEESGHQKQ